MLSRKRQNDKEIPLPDNWCKELEETLSEVYREKSLDSQKSFFVQGNFSPKSILKEHSEYLIDFNKFIGKMNKLNSTDRKGWLCSLSHGVLPKTPEINVRHFVTEIRNAFSQDNEMKGFDPDYQNKIGEQNTSRDEMLKNLIKVLESQGFKIKNKK